ncbi:TnpV protein [Bengtsoniella intestinalis]|uniref:TnpV protein n=1 Tax=Bengtsoniella intestinalis TaxID=3073143 RepID=UPI00391FA2CE
MSEKLHSHLVEIDQTADRQMEQLMADLQKTQPTSDKTSHQMEWVGHMKTYLFLPSGSGLSPHPQLCLRKLYTLMRKLPRIKSRSWY